MPAQAAFASLIAAGELGPWWSARVVLTPLTSMNPKVAAMVAAVRVAGRVWNRQSVTTATTTPASPSQFVRPRPIFVDSEGKRKPPSRAPTASAVLCRPATAALVPCSSRSSGTTGPKP